jgi:predicted NBD/HSP70 family sugar kinase
VNPAPDASRAESRPAVRPPLDPSFRPLILALWAYRRRVEGCGSPVPACFALEQPGGLCSHFQLDLLPDDAPGAGDTARLVERLVKVLLYARGGARVTVNHRSLADGLRRHFAETETGRFDADLMARIYGRPFDVVYADTLPPERVAARPLGKHLDGCRIGFDLGASDVKVAAVREGEPVFSAETAWNPVEQTDPAYHLGVIQSALRRAAEHLPRVDAIGGSTAGVIVANRIRVASLFRGVPKEVFDTRVNGLFLELQDAWGGIPFQVVNDGDVTALAGSMQFGENAVLGIAMGSSEAAGYVDPRGGITSWLNELAFAPVDLRDAGPRDEWSGDRGCGVQFFSQQGVARLMPAAGIAADPAMPLPERLVLVQDLMKRGDARARALYATIGVCLGYAVALYAEFYAIRNILLLGRVTTGDGGAVILDEAKRVLNGACPELAERITFRTPDERAKRHGQAVAAASLPERGPKESVS